TRPVPRTVKARMPKRSGPGHYGRCAYRPLESCPTNHLAGPAGFTRSAEPARDMARHRVVRRMGRAAARGPSFRTRPRRNGRPHVSAPATGREVLGFGEAPTGVDIL